MVQLRAKAAQKGYDPNIWFDNVEMVAASDVGAEPVQYVANIFKSYVAYHYSAEVLAKRDTARASAGIEAE
jgi:membrane-bound lytic murein transglycosylase MltF